jgi:hypothetical protein
VLFLRTLLLSTCNHDIVTTTTCIHDIVTIATCYYFQMYESESDGSEESDDDSVEFWNLILCGAKVAEKYVDLYLNKNPARIAEQSGWAGYNISSKLQVNVILSCA